MNQPNQSNNTGNRPAGKSRSNNFKNRRRHRGNFNKNKPANPSSSVERLVEKYINLLDQHLIARRKFHDLYYRAEDAQLNKLERNFYSTLNDMRDFESKILPEQKEAFEKRINGLKVDDTYSSNHGLPFESNADLTTVEITDPHYLQTQIKADYKEDTEESLGSIEDYNKYKMI